MNAATLLGAALLAFLPISELRGAIPFAVAGGTPWYVAYPFAALVNACVAPVSWLFLSTFHRLFLRIGLYRRLFDRFVGRARDKLRPGVERWGWLGVALFVAVPLPVTGAWTGSVGAWVLGLDRRRALAGVVLGVFAAGAIVTAVTVLGIQALGVFVKR